MSTQKIVEIIYLEGAHYASNYKKKNDVATGGKICRHKIVDNMVPCSLLHEILLRSLYGIKKKRFICFMKAPEFARNKVITARCNTL